VLSTATSTAVEEVNAAHGRPVWYQLYAPSTWEACERIVRRVEAAGCPVIALTVDNTTGRNSETFLRTRPKDLRQCGTCHEGGTAPSIKERKMYDGINMTGVSGQNPAMTWEFVDRLRKATSLKLFIKGIDGRDDARLAVEHGFDGILVSNHGGRSTETGRATIEALPEVVAEVGNRIPVFLWGLGAFGQAGVDRVLEILQGELKLVMGNCGTRAVADIDRSYVATPDWRV
jgi:isopentenyl diphosphate isomerase/L-lactate dehydrogenase-like FMN-dependent dehydrogenase